MHINQKYFHINIQSNHQHIDSVSYPHIYQSTDLPTEQFMNGSVFSKPTCISMHLPIYPHPTHHLFPNTFICLQFAFLPINLPNHLPTFPPTYKLTHIYMYIPTQVYLLSDYLPPHPLTYALNYLPSSLHVYLFTYLPTYLCSYPSLFPSSFKSNPILASFTNTFLISGCMEKDF